MIGMGRIFKKEIIFNLKGLREAAPERVPPDFTEKVYFLLSWPHHGPKPF
jgi:hypothetical protein